MRFFSSLDLKLAFRMLVRHPGLTALAGLSMAFAILVGAGTFEVMKQVLRPTLPLPDGDRIVQITYQNAATERSDRRLLYDLRVWREELESVEGLGAFRPVERNLTIDDGLPSRVRVAELDAAALELARTPALLGRLLGREDEAPGAPLVVVLSHDLWTDRFDADPAVLGKTIELGGAPATVVGVMPEGFAYPSSGEIWAPLRVGPAAAPGEGPAVEVVGRLRPGRSIERARDEVAALTAAMAEELPQRYAGLASRVRPLASLDFPILDSATLVALFFAGSNLPLVLFLVLVCGNVALLMFARAATRQNELVVRNALGASRGRIVGQLFAEALALAVIAGGVGLALTSSMLRWLMDVFERAVLEEAPLPFWIHASLSPGTILYAIGLTTLGAVIAGVIPGLRVTRSIAGELKRASAGGGGFRFGGIWTAVIVAQVAVTMMFSFVSLLVKVGPVEAVNTIDDTDSIRTPVVGSPAQDYLVLTAWFEPDAEGAGQPERLPRAMSDLEARLEADPRVAGVTLAEHALGTDHPWRRVEVDGPSAPPRRSERGHRTGEARVALDYFDVLGLPILSGRGFDASDLEPGANAVIVNRAFVDEVLGDRNAVGTRIRYVASEENRASGKEPGPWLEIVGVVPTTGKMSRFGSMGVYRAATPESWERAAITVHVSDARSFVGPALAAVAKADPDLLVRDLMPLDRVTVDDRDFFAFGRWVLLVTSVIAVLLSLGGIYSVMAVTVSQRTREIGVRVALGSGRLHVLGTVFRKPLTQVALGIAVGAVAMPILMTGPGEVQMDRGDWAFFGAYLVLVLLVCSLACVVPSRRALRIQPAEALRAE